MDHLFEGSMDINQTDFDYSNPALAQAREIIIVGDNIELSGPSRMGFRFGAPGGRLNANNDYFYLSDQLLQINAGAKPHHNPNSSAIDGATSIVMTTDSPLVGQSGRPFGFEMSIIGGNREGGRKYIKWHLLGADDLNRPSLDRGGATTVNCEAITSLHLMASYDFVGGHIRISVN